MITKSLLPKKYYIYQEMAGVLFKSPRFGDVVPSLNVDRLMDVEEQGHQLPLTLQKNSIVH